MVSNQAGGDQLLSNPHSTLATNSLRRGGRIGIADDLRGRHVARPLLYGLPRSDVLGQLRRHDSGNDSAQKNRASIIMWSMENESFSGKEKTDLALQYLPRAGRKAKEWDPTRPIYFESDGDPGGVADAIGLHYVHEYPQFTCWPNEAYWLDKPFRATSWYIEDDDLFVWKKNKPFYMGEFLWAPSGTPAPHTIFYGDDAYRDLEEYQLLAKAEVWKMQILAFRDQEAGGISPWTVDEGDLSEKNPLYRAHQYAYQPIAAYCLDYDSRFFEGESVERRVSVFNDVLSTSNLKFVWTLADGDNIVDRGQEEIILPAGEKTSRKIKLQMPTVSVRTPLDWKLELIRDGKKVFEETHDYSVFPRKPLPALTETIGLFEPNDSRLENLFSASDVKFQSLDLLTRIPPDLKVVVIAPNSFQNSKQSSSFVIGRVDPQRGALQDFLGRGGRVLVLRQESYPTGLFDAGLTTQKSTMTFPLRSSHAALQGLTDDDLKFWRGDHMVAINELSRPSTGSAVSIVGSGSKTGIANVPVLERPVQRGTVIHSQLLLIDKIATEPAAGLLLGNLLKYLDRWESSGGKTVLLGGDELYRQNLRGNLQLNFEEYDKRTLGNELDEVSLVICSHEASLDRPAVLHLKRFVERGGTLLMHRPSPKTFQEVCDGLNIDLDMQPRNSVITKANIDHPLQEAITREDLYWTGKVPGESWTRQPMSQDVIGGVFGVKFKAAGLRRYEIERWKSEGEFVRNTQQGVLFASQGTSSNEIEISETGLVGIGVIARGTVCNEEYPIVQFSIDGMPFGSVRLDSKDWKTYGVVGHLTKGNHQVTVAFVNDASDEANGEDRNLEVDAVFAGAIQNPTEDVSYLTVPGAVAVVNRGQGRVVFDNIRWDTEKQNGQKAARYACSMLTALGGDFTPPPSVIIETEQMTPNPGIPYYNVQGGITYMGSNGNIKTNIEVVDTQTYNMELLAAGEASEGVFPLVEVHVDGRKVAEIQLTTGVWRRYPVKIPLEKGNHEFKLQFVNDHWSPTGDRNLELDKVIFYVSD